MPSEAGEAGGVVNRDIDGPWMFHGRGEDDEAALEAVGLLRVNDEGVLEGCEVVSPDQDVLRLSLDNVGMEGAVRVLGFDFGLVLDLDMRQSLVDHAMVAGFI